MNNCSLDERADIAAKLYEIHKEIQEGLDPKNPGDKEALVSLNEFVVDVSAHLKSKGMVVDLYAGSDSVMNEDVFDYEDGTASEDSSITFGATRITQVLSPPIYTTDGTNRILKKGVVRAVRNTKNLVFNDSQHAQSLYDALPTEDKKTIREKVLSGQSQDQTIQDLKKIAENSETGRHKLSQLKAEANKMNSNHFKRIASEIVLSNRGKEYNPDYVESIVNGLLSGELQNPGDVDNFIVDRFKALTGVTDRLILKKHTFKALQKHINNSDKLTELLSDLELAENNNTDGILALARVIRTVNGSKTLQHISKKYLTELVQDHKNDGEGRIIDHGSYNDLVGKRTSEVQEYDEVQTLKDPDNLVGTDVISEVISPAIKDKDGNIVIPAKVVVTKGTKEKPGKKPTTVAPTSTVPIKEKQSVGDNFSSQSKKSNTLLKDSMLNGELVNFSWLNKSFDGKRRKASEHYRLKQLALNSDNAKFTLKHGDIATDLANENNPKVKKEYELQNFNDHRPLPYIEVEVEEHGQKHTILFAAFPAMNDTRRAQLDKLMNENEDSRANVENVVGFINRVSELNPGDSGIDVTHIFRSPGNVRFTKGQIVRFTPAEINQQIAEGKKSNSRLQHEPGYISLREFMDRHKPGNTGGNPIVKFSKDRYIFNHDVEDGNGKVIIKSGEPVLFATQDVGREGNYREFNEFLNDVNDGSVVSIPKSVTVIQLKNKSLPLHDMLDLFEGNPDKGERILTKEDSKRLIGPGQIKRFKLTLEEILKVDISPELRTYIEEFLDPKTKITLPEAQNSERSIFSDKTKNDREGISKRILYKLSQDRKDPSLKPVIDQMWAMMKEVTRDNPNGETSTIGYRYGIYTNVDHKPHASVPKDEVNLKIMIVKESKDKRLDDLSLASVNLSHIYAPNIVLSEKALYAFNNYLDKKDSSKKPDHVKVTNNILKQIDDVEKTFNLSAMSEEEVLKQLSVLKEIEEKSLPLIAVETIKNKATARVKAMEKYLNESLEEIRKKKKEKEDGKLNEEKAKKAEAAYDLYLTKMNEVIQKLPEGSTVIEAMRRRLNNEMTAVEIAREIERPLRRSGSADILATYREANDAIKLFDQITNDTCVN